MHSPGICGVILVDDLQVVGDNAHQKPTLEAVAELIDALNADTDLILLAASAGAEALEPLAWSRAAYFVQLPTTASHADALRIALQDVLSRGRDTALVTSPSLRGLTPETVHGMISAYCAAGDAIWAVVPDFGALNEVPVLMGRSMIELFLRSHNWNTAEDILAANRAHLFTVPADNDPANTQATASALPTGKVATQ